MPVSARQRLVERLWNGADPFTGFPRAAYAVDVQGWHSNNPLLYRAIEEVRPEIVIEVGVWKGASTITMAKHMRELGVDGVILAVDTWLGAWDHWDHPQWHADLAFEFGYPKLYHRFVANILHEDLQDYVLPLPLDSLNAAHVLASRGITADVVHIDGGHDFSAVTSDLTAWWPIIRDGGTLVGDDYDPSWPGVVEAFDLFFSHTPRGNFESVYPKVLIQKP